jgi:di/tricarboxylate transporter
MFITAMAANPLAVNLAAAEGINISWGLWALAGLAPGLICLATVPLILYALYPPGERSLAQNDTCLFLGLVVDLGS